jgi:V/A-type H+-transporting ATPase subunit F
MLKLINNHDLSVMSKHIESLLSKFVIQRIKKYYRLREDKLRIMAVGSRIFVTSFQLAGVEGIKVESASEALEHINSLDNVSDVGLVLISEDIGKDIRTQLTNIRANRPIPLIFELPAPGSTKENVDYRALLKQILGV